MILLKRHIIMVVESNSMVLLLLQQRIAIAMLTIHIARQIAIDL